MKRARIRIEAKDGNFMMSKVTDIDTGLIIPVVSVKIEMGVNNWTDGIQATLVVLVDELEIDKVTADVLTQEETCICGSYVLHNDKPSSYHRHNCPMFVPVRLDSSL